jgi:hypothetical protein
MRSHVTFILGGKSGGKRNDGKSRSQEHQKIKHVNRLGKQLIVDKHRKEGETKTEKVCSPAGCATATTQADEQVCCGLNEVKICDSSARVI